MEVYQGVPPLQQHHQQHPEPQQYYPNPFVDDAEKPNSISSGHYQQLHSLPQSQPDTNLAYNHGHGHGHGYASPMTPGTPVNYHPAHKVPITSHISSTGTSISNKKMNGSGNRSIINVQARLAGCILAVIVILFAAVIGLAAGLGMTQEVLRQTRSDLLLAQAKLVAPGTGNSNQATPAPAPAPAPPGANVPSPTTSTAPITAPTAEAAIKCPAANGTFYTAEDSGSGEPPKQFQRLCGIDYGQGEAKDIGSKKVASLDECMDACAAKEGCTGAGWGAIPGDKGNMHACWMKTGLIKYHKATPDWGFGRLVTGTTAGNST
ncbi:hypothetical protein V8F20_012283 [Naviculisporaceae sp. PSN 640]